MIYSQNRLKRKKIREDRLMIIDYLETRPDRKIEFNTNFNRGRCKISLTNKN